MRKLTCIIIAGFALLSFCACSTSTNEMSRDLAAQGQTTLEYGGFGASAVELRSAFIGALQERGWRIVSRENPIKAEIVKGGQYAKLSVAVTDDKLVMDTKGSYIAEDKAPYVPLRYVDFLLKSTRANLAKQNLRSK